MGFNESFDMCKGGLMLWDCRSVAYESVEVVVIGREEKESRKVKREVTPRAPISKFTFTGLDGLANQVDDIYSARRKMGSHPRRSTKC